MSIFFIIILILFGILLIVLEILIVPGFIVGLLGAVFVLLGIGWTWQMAGSTAGISVALGSIALTALAVWSALRTGFWSRFSLQDQLKGKMNVIDETQVQPGDKGAAVSSLRPMGTVRVNGRKFEASSDGEMIPPNYPVIVVKIEGYKLIVKPDRDR
jgi:membrane-bound ClpP family serine protease